MQISMLYDNRKWQPARDLAGIVHHVTRLTKKETQYLFRLADTVRAVSSCDVCGAKAGQFCTRKSDNQTMINHSWRVRQARVLCELHVLPNLEHLRQRLCCVESGVTFEALNQTSDSVDCMTCLVAQIRQ